MQRGHATQIARHPDIIAIGASAGGVETISELLKQLPTHLPASILVVLHRPAERISRLRQILAGESGLRVVIAQTGQPLEHGVCYIGEPHRHLILGPDMRLHLLLDGFYRGHSIDALFCSLARHAGRRTVGVVLTGMLKDGSLGLKAIKEAGGVALVQSPEEAKFPQMPENAIEFVGPVDLVAPIHILGRELRRLTRHEPELAEFPPAG
jgi:two-component system chemotaxis response regulator CheB